MGWGRAVLLASPFTGHLNPMLHLACVLRRSGRFSAVTVVHAAFNCPRAASFPDLEFVGMECGAGTSGEDYMAFLIDLNASCCEPFRRVVEGMAPVACLIVDAHMYFTGEVARQLRLPRLVFRTTSASSFRAFLAAASPDDSSPLSTRDGEQERQVPEFSRSTLQSTLGVLTQLAASARASDGVIINTFDALEQSDLEGLRADLRLPVIPVGPLHKLSAAPNNSGEQEEHSSSSSCSCMGWLDQQPSMSVLYVSFGSLACMDMHELLEAARGLADSHQRFLWVVRPGSVRGPASACEVQLLLEEVEQETRNRGRVMQWAPQLEVLAHPAVGAFWTHCGWNSAMESLCEGVPLLCSPFFGDQLANARMLTRAWGVGIDLGRGGFERKRVERGIRRLMAEDEGRELRRKAMRWKAEADDICARRGRSLHSSIERLLDQLLSLSLSLYN